MPDHPKYHLVSAEDLDTIQEALGYMVDRAETPAAFQRADDLTKRIESGKPLVDMQLFVNGEWSGLYVDGKLAAYGDHYHSEDRLHAMVSMVEHRGDDGNNVDWLKDGESEPFGTIEEVEARRMERLGGEAEVARKLAEAERLLAEATEIDGKKRFVGAA